MPPFRVLLGDLPRWLFLGLLIFAPWAYGSTRLWAVDALTSGLGVTLGLWGLGLLVERRHWPRASAGWWLVPVGLLLLQGWWMALNARFVYDPDFLRFAPTRNRWLPGAAGSVEAALSRAWMWQVTAMFGAACFVAVDLGRRPEWVLRLWKTCGLAGASVALLGLVQRASGAAVMFWGELPEPADRVTTFFGPYHYHANAGAFFNLTFPPLFGLFLRSLGQSSQRLPARLARLGWGGATLVLGLAMAVNTSRAAQALGALLVAALLLGPGRPLLRRAREAMAERGLAGAVLLAVALAALAAIAWSSGVNRPFERWGTFGENFAKDARWLAPQAAWVGVRETAGAFGLGPGVFRAVFPYFTGGFGDRLLGVWTHLHEDYVQTVLEWGWVGAALWAWWFLGGILTGARRAFSRGDDDHARRRLWLPRQRALLPLAVLALGSVALHALVDFPLQIASLQLYVATYLGICWGSGSWGRPEKDVREKA